jgi:hypothetical protein
MNFEELNLRFSDKIFKIILLYDIPRISILPKKVFLQKNGIQNVLKIFVIAQLRPSVIKLFTAVIDKCL